jgi:hypothetical protein
MVNISGLTARQKPEKSAKFAKKIEQAREAHEQKTTKSRA